MIVYILTFFLSVLLFCLIAKDNKARAVNGKSYRIKPKSKKFKITRFGLAVFCASLPPMFISAARYYVGTDYLETYYSGFYRILEGSVVDGFEIGFYLLNRFIQLFSSNAFWLFAVTSIIIVGTTYKAMADISIDVPLSIILFLATRYYFIGMNGVRQFMGLAFLAYSIRYVFERDFKRFGVYVFMASIFHYTCLLFIPVYFISKVKLNMRRIILAIIGDIAVFSVGVPLILRALIGTKYGLLAIKYDLAGIKFTIFTIAVNVILFIVGYASNNRRKNDLKYCTCLNIQFLALLASFGLHSIPLIERVYWIFSFPIIITFPYLLSCLHGKSLRRFVKWGIVLTFVVYMFYDICILKDHGVLPYQWIFGKRATHFSGWEWYGGAFK